MLLRVVPDLEAVPRFQLPRVRLVDTGEHAQQRGLARTVETEYDHLGTAIDGQIDIGEDLERPVRLRQA